MPAPASSPFAYAIVRIVPRVERGERFNAGVILFCRQLGFLAARVWLDEARLRALAPDVSERDLRAHLDAIVAVAPGEASAGPMASLPPSERFGWLVAPSSTMIQPSEVHTGLSADPAATLNELHDELVAPPATSPRERVGEVAGRRRQLKKCVFGRSSATPSRVMSTFSL